MQEKADQKYWEKELEQINNPPMIQQHGDPGWSGFGQNMIHVENIKYI